MAITVTLENDHDIEQLRRIINLIVQATSRTTSGEQAPEGPRVRLSKARKTS